MGYSSLRRQTARPHPPPPALQRAAFGERSAPRPPSTPLDASRLRGTLLGVREPGNAALSEGDTRRCGFHDGPHCGGLALAREVLNHPAGHQPRKDLGRMRARTPLLRRIRTERARTVGVLCIRSGPGGEIEDRGQIDVHPSGSASARWSGRVGGLAPDSGRRPWLSATEGDSRSLSSEAVLLLEAESSELVEVPA